MQVLTKRADETMLASHKLHNKHSKIQKIHYILMTVSIHQGGTIIINLHTPYSFKIYSINQNRQNQEGKLTNPLSFQEILNTFLNK